MSFRARSEFGADDHAVGLEEVVERRAFLEELGVGDDVELCLVTSAIASRTWSAVPTGTVLLSTTTV